MTPEQIGIQHLERLAVVYIRQSTVHQVRHHLESLRRQRQLVQRAQNLGWPAELVVQLDEDLGRSAGGRAARAGFEKLVADVALGKVGLVLALEASRLSRNNHDWYHLLDVCAVTRTLIGDGEGLYDPRNYNDRLLLGLKGTMSEAELHVMKQRLVEAMNQKAQRGELRRRLPAGYIWDEADRTQKHPDEQVQASIALIFERFDRLGSIHQTHLSLVDDGVVVPVVSGAKGRLSWRTPHYGYLNGVLKNPTYAGAYVYGRRQTEERIDEQQQVRKHVRKVEREQWHVLIPDHHEGYISWEHFERNQAVIKANRRSEGPGAAREGEALLPGLVRCGRCGRRMRVEYGRESRYAKRYVCTSTRQRSGLSACMSFGAIRLEKAVEKLVCQALEPLGMEAMLEAEQRYLEVRSQEQQHWEQRVERAQYEVDVARRAYDAVDPTNRLVARELERRFDGALQGLATVETEAKQRLAQLDKPLADSERKELRTYAEDISELWRAPTTRPQDRKRIVRALVDSVNVDISESREQLHAELHWVGGEVTPIELSLPQPGQHCYVTDKDVVELIQRLAGELDDAQIALILSKKGVATSKGHSYTAHRVAGVRRNHAIPKGPGPLAKRGPDIYTAQQAGQLLGVTNATVVRWLHAGVLRGAQVTPGAPWRVQVTDADRQRLKTEDAPDGWWSLKAAAAALEVTQQTVLNRLSQGQLEGVRVKLGRRTSWRIRPIADSAQSQAPLFD